MAVHGNCKLRLEEVLAVWNSVPSENAFSKLGHCRQSSLKREVRRDSEERGKDGPTARIDAGRTGVASPWRRQRLCFQADSEDVGVALGLQFRVLRARNTIAG